MTTKQNIEKVLWSACDSFRGKIDSSRYKDYILSMLFVKYLSDVYAYTRKKYSKQYGGNEERIKRAMSRERFVMDETSTFDYLYENRNDTAIGEKINIALANIEKNNSAKLHKVVGMIRKDIVEIFDPLKDFIRLPRAMRRQMSADDTSLGIDKITAEGPVLKVEVIAIYK